MNGYAHDKSMSIYFYIYIPLTYGCVSSSRLLPLQIYAHNIPISTFVYIYCLPIFSTCLFYLLLLFFLYSINLTPACVRGGFGL